MLVQNAAAATRTDLIKRTDVAVPLKISETRQINLRHRFDCAQAEYQTETKSDALCSSILFYGGLGAIATTMFVAPIAPVTMPVFAELGLQTLAAMGIGSLITSITGIGSTKKSNVRRFNHRMRAACRDLKEIFEEAQKEAFAERQETLVNLAEQTLAEGHLLDEDVLAALAVLPVKTLKDASDELAISVLQARGMLAYHRCSEWQANGEKAIQKPLTFAQIHLNPALDVHRQILRERLERVAAEDWALAEESPPDIEKLEFRFPEVKRGYWGNLGRTVAAPLFLNHDLKEARRCELPDLPETSVPPLELAQDFGAALAGYEKNVEKLDLPALRGGVKSAAPLPKPLQRLPL